MSKLLIYDGDCPLCEALSAGMLRWPLRGTERRALQSLESGLRDRLLEAGMREEMAVLETATGEIRMGVAGFAWALSERRPGLARLLARPWVLRLLGWIYGWIASNRRILAPPPRPAFECACEPAARPARTMLLIALFLAIAVAETLAAGALAGPRLGFGPGRRGALAILAITGSGWLVPALAIALALAGRRLIAFGHLSIVMAGGAAIFLAGALLGALLPGSGLPAALGVAASFAWMLRSVRRRLAFLALPGWVAALWAAGLWAGSGAALWLLWPR